MRLWGKILTIVGAVVLLVSVVGGVALAATGVSEITDLAGQSVVVDPTASVTYEAGDTFQLYQPTSSVGRPDCEITGPAQLDPGSNVSTGFAFDGTPVESFESFEVVEAGTYSFVCSDRVIVASVDAEGILAGVGGVLIAVFGGAFGGLLALVGIVLWAIAGRKPR